MKLSELARELGYKSAELKALVEHLEIPVPEKGLSPQLVALVRAKVPAASRVHGSLKSVLEEVREKRKKEKERREEARRKREEARRRREEEKRRREEEKRRREEARKKRQEERRKRAEKKAGKDKKKPTAPEKKKVKAIELDASVQLRPVEDPGVPGKGTEADVDFPETGKRTIPKPVIELPDKPDFHIIRPTEIDRYSRESDRVRGRTPTQRERMPRSDRRGRRRGLKTREQTGAGGRLMKSLPAAPRGKKDVRGEKKKVLRIRPPITVREFSAQSGIKIPEILRKLMDEGLLATVNTALEEDQIVLLGLEFDIEVEVIKEKTLEEKVETRVADLNVGEEVRAPVVTLMGHVDHGKTTLLDSIRKTNIVEKEFGGITQHIGAYRVHLGRGKFITFLDTPGHEAFTRMRSRGANVTDIAVIVVAADEGVMPQTEEAISHARDAGVTIMTAITKVDKGTANLTKVKQQLAKAGLIPEEYGGDIVTVQVSGRTGQGIPKLLELIELQAELLELKADPRRKAVGTVLEARYDRGKGPVATVLVQNGTLRRGDWVVAGTTGGRIRAMFDENGRTVNEAGPSVPVEVMGLQQLPEAGDRLAVVDDPSHVKEILRSREESLQKTGAPPRRHVTLETLFKKIEGGEKELKVILKGDVHGSVEAIEDSLNKISVEEVSLKVIHKGVGAVSESDVLLADAADAVILGFNVSAESRAKNLARSKGVDIRTYKVIYELLEHVEAAMEGLLEPERVEETIGHCEVKQTFQIPRAGTVAGCLVREGKVERSAEVRIRRGGEVLHTGKIESLKRFKEDVREVAKGLECGIKLAGFDDVRQGDELEVFVVKQVARKATGTTS